MLQAVWIAFGLLECSQGNSVRFSLGKFISVIFENLENFFTDVAAFLAELIVHPESLTTDVNPATAFQVSQMARYGGLR